MLQKYSRYRVLQEFFDYPRKEFHLRELSRRVKLAQISVSNHLKGLLAEKLIVKETKGLYPAYRANRDDPEFRLLKKQNLVWRLNKVGIINEIEEKCRPNCIVFFGSASRGEDLETSDVDLFVQAKEAEIDMRNYEIFFKRKVNILFEPDINALNKELLNNIINGEVLQGYLKVF